MFSQRYLVHDRLILERNMGVALSIVMLAAANGWEAYQISLSIAS